MRMNIVLCGYHWTGCKALEMLLRAGNEVYVYTHKSQNGIADLEGFCRKNGIGYTFEKISMDNLPYKPDVICSIYYRYIISREVIDVVEGKIFNLHPSLLPKYRGCSSLTWALIHGERECGFTYHYIDEGCDTGNIIIQKAIKIEEFDTQLTLYHKVMFEAMLCFEDALDKVLSGDRGVPQIGIGSLYKRGCPLNGEITDDMDDEFQERFVRAMIYPPYPSASYKGSMIETLAELEQMKSISGGGNL